MRGIKRWLPGAARTRTAGGRKGSSGLPACPGPGVEFMRHLQRSPAEGRRSTQRCCVLPVNRCERTGSNAGLERLPADADACPMRRRFAAALLLLAAVPATAHAQTPVDDATAARAFADAALRAQPVVA